MVEPGRNLELAVLAVKQGALKGRDVRSGRLFTVRPKDGVYDEVEGELITLAPARVWRLKKTDYISGKIVSRRIDIAALGLKPLALTALGMWDPEEEYWGEEDEPVEDCIRIIIARGPRPLFEMEQVIPGGYVDGSDYDPICDAVEHHNCGKADQAYKIIENLLLEDIRCIDAHAHLGSWLFNRSDKSDLTADPLARLDVEKAMRHYEVGMRIAELSLGENFDGVMAWSLVDNRPYLRCLHGFGLCHWRLGNPDAARSIFYRLLWLNPQDNQGVRFLIDCIAEGLPWGPEI